jgi:chromate transporter
MAVIADSVEAPGAPLGSFWEVLAAAVRLGLTSFGGPVAHLGYFREEYVERRRWVVDGQYADIVALCQFLPGPASSQVGMSIGILRAGIPGAFAAWLGFTLPSAALLVAFAYGLEVADVTNAGWLQGLKIAAVAVVAQAVAGMSRTLAPDRERVTIAVAAAVFVLLLQTAWSQVLAIALAAAAGWFLFRSVPAPPSLGLRVPVGRRLAIGSAVVFVALLVGLPLASRFGDSHVVDVLDSFYVTGSLVFGGGHVVLPLLHDRVVDPGWINDADFVAGYGAAQAVPGPLFTFSAYLGAAMTPEPNGVSGATLALVAVFLPSFLLVFAALPLWDLVRNQATFRSALMGINAAVVGILVAALYDPVWTSAILRPEDFALAAVAFVALVYWRFPPWLVVVLCAAGGALLAA